MAAPLDRALASREGSIARLSSTLRASELSPRTTVRAHREAGLRLRELRLYQPWYDGPSAREPGPHLISVNEYRPHRLTDVAEITRISAELKDLMLSITDAVGIVTSYQPRHRITYSLSLWRSEEARREFTFGRAHREVMREYRSRGYLRHVNWWGEHRSIGASMAEARRRLDAGEGRRVGDARDAWARTDQRRLAALAAS